MRKKVVEKIPFENAPAFRVIYEDGTQGIEMMPTQSPGPQVGEPQGPYEGSTDRPIDPGEADKLMDDYMYEMKMKDPSSTVMEGEIPDEPLPRKK